jgi:type II secretory pathway component PulM
MANNEGFFSQKRRELSDKIQDQVWFQQIRSKWDELDPKSRMILRTGGLVLSVILLVGYTGVLYSEVQKKKQLIEERQELVTKLQKSQEELRQLRDSNPLTQAGDSDETWTSYIQSKLGSIGIASEAVTIDSEKMIEVKDKNATDRPRETVVEGSLKKVNIRQLVKLIHQMENGGRPAKVKRLRVETEPDESGYLNLSFTMLGYSFPKR